MFYNNIDPILLHIGPFEIRYYGVFIVISLIIAYFLIYYLAKERKLKLSRDDVSEYLIYIMAGTIVMARLFYVFVYNFKFYFNSPLEIFAVWNGGLSFHGGLIGAVIGSLVFCRKKKLSFYELADITVIPLAIGLFFGRMANFLNSELYGRITSAPWAVKFKGAEGFRHPSQLYESLKNLFIFFALWHLRNKKLPKGALFLIFVCLYSFLRFFIEFFRAPDIQIGFIYSLTLGQILNIVMFFAGLLFLYILKKR